MDWPTILTIVGATAGAVVGAYFGGKAGAEKGSDSDKNPGGNHQPPSSSTPDQ